MNTEIREQCPCCGSRSIAKILWGLPDFLLKSFSRSRMTERSSSEAVCQATLTMNAKTAEKDSEENFPSWTEAGESKTESGENGCTTTGFC